MAEWISNLGRLKLKLDEEKKRPPLWQSFFPFDPQKFRDVWAGIGAGQRWIESKTIPATRWIAQRLEQIPAEPPALTQWKREHMPESLQPPYETAPPVMASDPKSVEALNRGIWGVGYMYIAPAVWQRFATIRAASGTLTPGKARNILGVKSNATPSQIRSAYRNLAKQYHPDMGTMANEAKFVDVNAAYDLLSKDLTTLSNMGMTPQAGTQQLAGQLGGVSKELGPTMGAGAAAQLPLGVSATPLIPRAIPEGVTFMPPEGYVPGMAQNVQKIEAHRIAYSKGLIDAKTGNVTPAYRRLAQGITGQKSMLKMTEAQAGTFIEALNGLEVKGGRPPKIPGTKNLIPQAMANRIPFLREIGLLEKIRPTRQVFTKMGLLEEVWRPAFEAETVVNEQLRAFESEIGRVEKALGGDAVSRRVIFQALENPELLPQLSAKEYTAYQWFKSYFDKRADDLNLPLNKRRENYVTHIFEEDITKALREQNQMPFELVKALDFITPKQAFNPYLKERLGRTLGLKEDPFDAARAYEYKALRSIHYTPLIQKIRLWDRFLPPAASKYLRGFMNRITNRPLAMDREMGTTMKEFGEAIKKFPGGERLSEFLGGEKAGQMAAYRFTNMLYFSWLGFKPTSAVRNLSQNILTMAEVGPLNFAKGITSREAGNALKESLVMRSRRRAYLPGIEDGFKGGWTTNMRETSMAMFRAADRVNVTNAFKAGFTEARRLGLERDWAIKRGDEVAADTQYIYTKLAGASWSQTALGRVLSPLTTWPENWVELMTRWVKGRPSQVYKAYTAETGIDIEGQMSWADRKKSIFIYATIVAGAYYAQKQTRLRALEYTGFTSIQYIADILSGDLPALSIPGAAAQAAAGFITQNEWMMRQGISNLKPDRLLGAYRLARRVITGEADWLTLLLYISPRENQPTRPTKPRFIVPTPKEPTREVPERPKKPKFIP